MSAKPLLEVIPPLDRTFRIYTHDYPFPYSGWHHHSQYEIHLIRKSSGLFYVGTYKGLFAPGNLVMVGPHLPHMWVSDEQGRVNGKHSGPIVARDRVLQFSADFADRCVADFGDCSALSELLNKARVGIEFSAATAGKVARLMSKLGHAQGFQRLSLFFVLLRVLTADEGRKCLSLLGTSHECTEPKRLDSALSFIAVNFSRADLTCEEIASRQGMSLSAFSRFFSRHVKCACLEYVNHLRVYKACQLLLETDERITTICFDVGYETLSTFNRNFARLMGTSPSAFRIERRSTFPRAGTKSRAQEGDYGVSWN